MRRFLLFLLLVGVSLLVFLLTAAWYLISYQSYNATMNTMMNQMMGNNSLGGGVMPMSPYFWMPLTTSVAVAITGAVGIVYYLAFPEIRIGKPTMTTLTQNSVAPSGDGNPNDNLRSVVRTFNPDERKVIEVLLAHEGSYLQKFIVKESGMSRLKIHRIVSRFAERGIVAVVKSGNTNEVSLAPWLKAQDGLSS